MRRGPFITEKGNIKTTIFIVSDKPVNTGFTVRHVFLISEKCESDLGFDEHEPLIQHCKECDRCQMGTECS